MNRRANSQDATQAYKQNLKFKNSFSRVPSGHIKVCMYSMATGG